MTDIAEDIDLSGLTSDFPASSEAAAAASTVTEETPAAGTSEGDGGSTGTEAQNVAQGSGEASANDGPLDLAKLQALAEQRRAAAPAPKADAPKADEPKAEEAPALTADAIARAVTSGNAQLQAAAKALEAGDLSALVRAIKGDDGDAAGVFERFGRHAMDPDGAKAADTIAKLQAEVNSLKESQGKLPDDVLTASKYEELQQKQQMAAAKAESESAFQKMVTDDAEAFPILSRIDKDTALDYAYLAQRMLTDEANAAKEDGRSFAFDLQDVSRIAEGIASSKIGGLLGQNRGPAPKTEGGSELPKAAGDAATGAKTEGTGEIDNRAASTTAATMPDPDDEDAWEHRLTSIAAGSRAP
jgi:FtsZ-binding cell division protein ZapB